MFNYLTATYGKTGMKPINFWEIKDFFNEFDNEYSSTSKEVIETDTQYEINLELPGYKKEDIKIKVIKDTLKINGKREKPISNSFEKSYLLTNVDKDSITASLTDGILSIIIKKKEVKQVEIPIS